MEDVGIERSDSGLCRAEGLLGDLALKIESIYEFNRTCLDTIEVRNMISVCAFDYYFGSFEIRKPGVPL